MSNFRGYLIRFYNTDIEKEDTTKGQKLSNKYISFKSYKSHPDQRLEVKAYRDANSLLHRITSPNYKTKIEFQTRSNLTLSDKNALFDEFKKGLINEQQRKYRFEYWNSETSSYATSKTDFYMPDIEFTIKRITEDSDNSNIIYEPIRIAFIEY